VCGYTWRQALAFTEVVNKRKTEELKGVAYITRLAFHGEDKTFDEFVKGQPDDGY
jgi:hypothetical protein